MTVKPGNVKGFLSGHLCLSILSFLTAQKELNNKKKEQNKQNSLSYLLNRIKFECDPTQVRVADLFLFLPLHKKSSE